MTKDDFAEHLRKSGYKAANEKGCVMVESPDKGTWKKVRKIAKEVGYTESYGWRKENEPNEI